MVFTSRLFSRASQVIIPFPSSVGKDLPLLEENIDLSIFSVRDSSSGHEIEQAPVGTGFLAKSMNSQTQHVHLRGNKGK